MATKVTDGSVMLHIRIPAAIHAELVALAQREDRTLASMIRVALAHYAATKK